MLNLAVSQLTHVTENEVVNRAIALGNWQVNTKQFRESQRTFEAVLKDDARSFSAYLGLGSARAMQGDLEGAAKDFSLAIKHGPAVAECWKRRGQTLQALGRRKDAIADLRKTVECMEEARKHPQENR